MDKGEKMCRKLLVLTIFAGFLSGMVSAQFFGISTVFAQKTNQEEKAINLSNIEQKINTVEKNVDRIGKKVDSLKEEISKNKVEVLAAKCLLEISEKNLVAPQVILGIIISILAILGGSVGYLVRRGILTRINENIEELKELRKELTMDAYELFGRINELAAVTYWRDKNYNRAFYFGEKAIENFEKVWGKEPKKQEVKEILYKYKSNLAYFYVEAGRDDKKNEAIRYAKEGLEIGKTTNDIQLIDNYLYVLMKFAPMSYKDEWLQTYENFKQAILKIRQKPGEKKEIESYYEKLKKA